ncbi:hypothetical protein H257_03076 [Aphanomyces astaci]|uniref:Uncharacterized protein n=1 Tax=Aphanomyces astaci TaxID=112090 RepID=W4H043_APHAT|nr:hypothetical protein H257_03076 [Aphanomyces astaci]ETV85277.1 hypothetical protein H257_03076 [Aphanomyces astaci]|eukprot:XP_009825295.1 hypothetical protein H257_03076 [Aphanomyces astaci]
MEPKGGGSPTLRLPCRPFKMQMSPDGQHSPTRSSMIKHRPSESRRGSSAGFNHLKLTPDGVVTGSSDHLQKSPILLVAPAPPAATTPAPLMRIPVHTRPTPPSSFGPVKTQLTTAAVTGPQLPTEDPPQADYPSDPHCHPPRG